MVARNYSFLLAVLLLSLHTNLAFFQLRHTRAHLLQAESGSYEDMLRKAKERRGQIQQPIPLAPALKNGMAPMAPRKVNNAVVAQAPAPKKIIKDGLPFDDDMYKHLKFVIEKITARLRSENALTPEDIKKLEVSIHAIITDSGVPVPSGMSSPDKNHSSGDMISPTINHVQVPLEDKFESSLSTTTSTTTTTTNKATDFVADSFDSLKGIGSTWNLVPNIDKLTTEEYYSELNKKLAEIRHRLDSEGLTGTGKGNDYLENLNAKRPQKS